MLLSPASFAQLCRARDLLCADLEQTPSLAELAYQLQISRFHLIRQFESLFGITPRQLVIRRRIEKAKELLAVGNDSVTEVCMAVGFSSLGSFSDLFSRRVGMSPSSYQRRSRMVIAVPGRFELLQPFPGCLSLMAFLPKAAFRNFEEATV